MTQARLAGARRFLAARLDRESYLGLHLSIGLAILFAAVWAFGALLEEVLDAATLVRLDLGAAAWMHERTTSAGIALFRVLTELGSPLTMTMLAIVGVAVLWRARDVDALIAWVAAFGCGPAIDQVLKVAVHRVRPVYGAAYLHGRSYSFPSGHAMASMIGYAMLVFLLRDALQRRGAPRRWLVAATAVASVIVVTIGVSRVYLGVHYPSDVVAGWAAGAAWAAVCLTGLSVARGWRRARVR